jgi:predicted dehydrogenase
MDLQAAYQPAPTPKHADGNGQAPVLLEVGNSTRKLGIGIVGIGGFGKHIIEEQILGGDASRFLNLLMVCDTDRTRANAAAAQYAVSPVYDIDVLLADQRVTVVGLFTGPVGRASLVRRAIQAGKDVITTKPFERDADAALEVLREARALNRVVYLNSPGPTMSFDLAQITHWRDEFELGRPVAARAEVWASYRENPDGSWYDDPDLCPAAPITRLGIYLINDLMRLFGDVETVQVLTSRLFTGRPTCDNAQLSLRFTNGALANIFASFCVNDGQFWRNAMTLNFENGTVYRNVGPARGPDARKNPELALVLNNENGPVARSVTAMESSEDYPWETFYHAVRGQRPPDEITPEQVAAGLRVLAAMRRAEISGCNERVV